MAENGSGAASAGSRSRGAAVRDADGRFRATRSFPAADGNGLSWSGAAGSCWKRRRRPPAPRRTANSPKGNYRHVRLGRRKG